MTSLRYQIVVVYDSRNYFAHSFELDCSGGGATANEAVAEISEVARDILQACEDRARNPPTPCDLTLVTVDFTKLLTSGRHGTSADTS